MPALTPAQILSSAITAQDPAAVSRALEAHPELKARINDPLEGYGFGATPLVAAVHQANRDVIDVLLRAGADINQKSHWWAGPFGVMDDAWREPWLASFLIGRGATLEIHHAVRLGMFDEVQRMVSADPALVHARGGDGQLPLHFAQTVDMAALLVARGADVDARDIDHESTAAMYMVRERQDVARFLVAGGAASDILMASALGDAERVRGYLDADPESIRTAVDERYFPKKDPQAGGTIYIWTLGSDRTAPLVARDFGHDAIHRLLMERTPDSMKLAIACALGDEDALARLLTSRPGLARELTLDEQRTLVTTAMSNNTNAVGLMLQAGWPVDAVDLHGTTALHCAAFHGNAAMTCELLRHHAPVAVVETTYNATPLGWAIHGSLNSWHKSTGDYAAVVAALLDAGAQTPPAGDLRASQSVLELLRGRVAR